MYGMLLALTAAAVGADWGYRPLPEGGHEYIIQIAPRAFDDLVNSSGGDIISDVPSSLQDARQYRVTIGTQRLPRGGQARPSGRRSEPAQGVHVRWLNVRGGAYEHVIELDPSAVKKMREEMDLVDSVRNVRRFRIRMRRREPTPRELPPAPREVMSHPAERSLVEPRVADKPATDPWQPTPLPPDPHPTPGEEPPPLAPVKHLSPPTPVEDPAPQPDLPPIEDWPAQPATRRPEAPRIEPDLTPVSEPREEPEPAGFPFSNPLRNSQETPAPATTEDPPLNEESPPADRSEDPFPWPNALPEDRSVEKMSGAPPSNAPPSLPPWPEQPAVENNTLPYGTQRIETSPIDSPAAVSTGTVPSMPELLPGSDLTSSLVGHEHPPTRPIDDVGDEGGPATESKPRMASAVIDSDDKPWWALTLALFGLFASLGGVVYLAWINWGMRRQYASLLAMFKQQRGKEA